jgi:hypothetical protein
MYIKHGRNKKVRKRTKGWNLCVEWKDGTTSWERLADLKESNPVEVDEYADAKSFIDTPVFMWWSPNLLKKCMLNYSHSRIPPCAPARMHGQIQAPREPPN